MASQLHTYTVHTRWSGGREGSGSISNANSGQGYELRVPPEFGGPGGALNPEELLTDAISGCYSITFGIVAANRRIPVKSIEVEAIGTVDQSGVNFVYSSIALSPKITLAADATDQDIATAVDMAHKADAYCIVTNAIRDKVQVSISPSVQREGQETQETKPVSGDETLDSPAVATGATSVTGTSGTVASTSASDSAPEPTAQAQPDTAPKDETSYEGTEQTEEAYPEAGDAPKPDSATGAGSNGGAGTSTEAGSTGSAKGGSEAATEKTDESGVNPENSQADDKTASSEETGDPETMQVGAIPG